jgi:hypothetical protein
MIKKLLIVLIVCGLVFAEEEKTPMEASLSKEPKDKPIILLWPNFEYDTRSKETDMEMFVVVLGYRKVFDGGIRGEVSFRVDKGKEGSNKATINSAYITTEPTEKSQLFVGLQPSLSWFTRLLFYFKAHAKEYPVSLTGTKDGTGDLDLGVSMKYHITNELFMHGGVFSGSNRQEIDIEKQDFVYALNTEYRGAFWAVNLYTSIRPFNGTDSLSIKIPDAPLQTKAKTQYMISPFGCIGTPWAKVGLMYSHMENNGPEKRVRAVEVNVAIPISKRFEAFGRYVNVKTDVVEEVKLVEAMANMANTTTGIPVNGIYADQYTLGVEFKQSMNLSYAVKWDLVHSNFAEYKGNKVGIYGNFVY